MGLGVAQARAGRASEARAAFQEASEISRRLGNPRQFARAVLGLAGIGVTILDVDETLAAQLSDALELLPEAESDLRAGAPGAGLAIARAHHPHRQESARIAEQAVEVARSHDQPATLARALCAQHVSLGVPDRVEPRLAIATEMLELADRAGDQESALQARNFRVTDVLEAGDVPGFDRELEAYAALCHEFPLPVFRGTSLGSHPRDDQRRLRRSHPTGRPRSPRGRQAGDENAELFWRSRPAR